MKKIIAVILVIGLLFESKIRGTLIRHSPKEAQMIVSPIAAPPALSDTPTSAPVIINSPQCAIDWSLLVTDENQRKILSCYHLLYPAPDYGPPLCPPAFSQWESVFNSSVCWAINHGTPAALTATAIGPLPIPTATEPAAYP